jgi:hypothetical protein
MKKGHFGYDKAIPKDFRQMFAWLCQDVHRLTVKWRLYVTLFGSSDSREIVNRADGYAFFLIEDSLRHDLTMSFGRLLDPIQSSKKPGKRENISFAVLKLMLPRRRVLSALLNDFRRATRPILKLRNKRVGHRDRRSTLRHGHRCWSDVEKSQVDRSVVLAGEILTAAAEMLGVAKLEFDGPPTHRGGGALLKVLRRGVTNRRES